MRCKARWPDFETLPVYQIYEYKSNPAGLISIVNGRQPYSWRYIPTLTFSLIRPLSLRTLRSSFAAGMLIHRMILKVLDDRIVIASGSTSIFAHPGLANPAKGFFSIRLGTSIRPFGRKFLKNHEVSGQSEGRYWEEGAYVQLPKDLA